MPTARPPRNWARCSPGPACGSFSVAAGEGYYVPVGHHPEMAPGGQLGWEQVRAALAGALTDAAIEKVAHNAKYDFIVLQRNGLTMTPISADTMVA